MGKDGLVEDFETKFLDAYGSLLCSELRGGARGMCNDFVGTAARLAAEM